MTHLYEITEAHKELEKLEDEGLDIGDTFEAVEASFNDKAISVVHVIQNMGGNVSALETEIDRLSKRLKTVKNRQESIKEYLRFNMEATGINKISCDLFTISIKQGRDIVQIDDDSLIPTDYLNIKTSSTPMKREILADLKTGKEIAGASMAKSKSSISIK